MSELFVPDRPLHAVVGVELFDARTGRKVDESVGENYITPAGLAHNRWKVRNDYMASMPGSNNLDVEPLNPFAEVWLSDSTAAIDVNSSWPEGVPLAWANKSSYVGPDVYRGNPNSIECQASAASAKWVFDWPTHAGNGTINSVGFRPTSGQPYFAPSEISSVGHGGSYGGQTGICRLPDNRIVGGSNNAMAEFAVTPQGVVSVVGAYGPTTAQVGFSGQYKFGGVAVDATHMYVSGSKYSETPVIRKFPIPTSVGPVTAVSIAAVGYSSYAGVTYVAGRLFVTDTVSNKVLEIDSSSGAVVSEFSVPNVSWINSHAQRGTLLVGTTSDVTYEYQLNGTLIGRFLATAGGFAGSAISAPEVGESALLVNRRGQSSLSGGVAAVRVAVGSRVLLPSPVTKTSLQTMKLTYTFTYA